MACRKKTFTFLQDIRAVSFSSCSGDRPARLILGKFAVVITNILSGFPLKPPEYVWFVQ
jgi:hypothetical protein